MLAANGFVVMDALMEIHLQIIPVLTLSSTNMYIKLYETQNNTDNIKKLLEIQLIKILK